MTQRIIVQSELPYFITANTSYRHPVFEAEKKAVLLSDIIQEACQMHQFALIGHSILPDHVHLLVWPQRALEKARCDRNNIQRGFSNPREADSSISRLMQSIKGVFSRSIHQGRIWQPRYNYRIIDSEERFLNTLQYIQFNYLKHGLPEKYGRAPYVHINNNALDQLAF